MGTPYLHSGESIVLTTHRVSVDGVAYDLMLTTERLFLIDNRNARFEPRIILLSSLLSVQGGKTPASDPVFTLLFRTDDSGTARQPLNFVFSQNPNEKRKAERDDWVRSLIQLSISQRENQVVPETTVIPEIAGETGLRPATRHGLAPERVRPLSNLVEREKEPVPVTVIPEEVDRSGEIPAAVANAMILKEESMVREKPPSGLIPGHESPPPLPVHQARVIIPQIIEEMLPEKTTPEPEMQEPAAVYDPEVLFRTIPTAVRSMTVTEERTPPSTAAGHSGDEHEPDVLTGAEGDELREIPEIIRALQIGSTEPVTTESPLPPPEDVPAGPVPESGGTPDRTTPESSIAPPAPDREEHEPAISQVPEETVQQEPVVPGSPPIRHPVPPAHEIRPVRKTLAYAAVVLVLIALVAAGTMLFLHGPGQAETTVTPVATLQPVITAPSDTVLPTSLPRTTIIPATSRLTTPEPSPASAAVPQDGVWVRVSSTAGYFGTLGNSGQMRTVSGTGDNFYKIIWSNQPVQVSVQKKDNSGARLTAAVYRNGTQIASRSVTSPMGSVDILIDPVTALAPGLTPEDTGSANTTQRTRLEDY